MEDYLDVELTGEQDEEMQRLVMETEEKGNINCLLLLPNVEKILQMM